MTQSRLEELIKQGENVSVEFKSCTTELSATTFETICAFLNRSGGHLMLGVKDSGEIVGVKEKCIESMTKNFINIANNDEQLNPTFFFSSENIYLKAVRFPPALFMSKSVISLQKEPKQSLLKVENFLPRALRQQ